MKSKILNSVLNGALKPWLITFDADNILKNIVKQVQNKPNNTKAEIKSNLETILQPFPNLLKQIQYPEIELIKPLKYTVNLTVPITLLNHYYKTLIDAEIARYYNATIHNPLIKDYELDVPFQIGHQSLKGIADLCNQTNNVIIERGFEENQTPASETTFFALTYLRNSLLALYFSIQETFEEHLPTVYNSFEEYALYCLESNFEIELRQEIREPTSIAKSDNKSFNFGFKGDKTNLINLIKVLCTHKNLLDQEVTSAEDLIELLTTSDINVQRYKIKIGCKTNLFTYIVESLKKTLPKLTFANIDRCNYFFSENNNPIKQSVLSNSKSNNSISKQQKEVIDKIFKENNM